MMPEPSSAVNSEVAMPKEPHKFFVDVPGVFKIEIKSPVRDDSLTTYVRFSEKSATERFKVLS